MSPVPSLPCNKYRRSLYLSGKLLGVASRIRHSRFISDCEIAHRMPSFSATLVGIINMVVLAENRHPLEMQAADSLLLRKSALFGCFSPINGSLPNSPCTCSGGADTIILPATTNPCASSSPSRYSARESRPPAGIAVGHRLWQQGSLHAAGRCWS
jgi:hypothetical protein